MVLFYVMIIVAAVLYVGIGLGALKFMDPEADGSPTFFSFCILGWPLILVAELTCRLLDWIKEESTP